MHSFGGVAFRINHLAGSFRNFFVFCGKKRAGGGGGGLSGAAVGVEVGHDMVMAWRGWGLGVGAALSD